MSRVDFVTAKAERLVCDGAVTTVPAPTAFLVQGSAPRPYMVVLAEVPGHGVTAWCSCPAGRVDCAHVQAARMTVEAASDACPDCHGDGWTNAGDDPNEARCHCNPAPVIEDPLAELGVVA